MTTNTRRAEVRITEDALTGEWSWALSCGGHTFVGPDTVGGTLQTAIADMNEALPRLYESACLRVGEAVVEGHPQEATNDSIQLAKALWSLIC
jgi:hypothetical protein